MSTEEISRLANLIAQKIVSIKSMEDKCSQLRSRLEALAQEKRSLEEELNRSNDMIKTLKHEVTNDLLMPEPKIKLVGNGE